MFEILYRIKELQFKTLNEYDKSINKLFSDEKKVELITIFIYSLFFILPLWFILKPFLEREDILSIIIVIIICIVFLIIFVKITNNYMWKLSTQGTMISNFLFFYIYTLKGNAILRDDCKKIKEYDKSLYHFIKTKECTGYCYQTCYYILSALKKGSIRFVAIKVREVEKIKNEFTMHVIYVNEDWCFDTFTRKQYKVEELMNFYKAKEFKSFSYNDVAEKSYEEFREDNYSEMKIWCKENDCHQKVV